MGMFSEYREQRDFVEFVINEFNGTYAPSTQSVPVAAMHPAQKAAVWSAKKPEILQMWKNLRGDAPIIVTPVSDQSSGTEHSTYGEDGIRLTGSWYFISSVLARLKELTAYENPQTKLRLIFRGVDRSRTANPNKESYVFYMNLEKRAHGQPGRPKKLEVPTPTPKI